MNSVSVLPPSDQVDEADPHTFIKIRILERYLNEWTAKLSGAMEIVYFDPFAGVGRIKSKDSPNSEAGGSAIAVLRLFHNHRALKDKPVIIRVFLNESETSRYNALVEGHVNEVKTLVENALPEHRLRVMVFNHQYPEAIDDMFRDLQGIPRCIFSFIDPYGYKDNTFEAVRKLLSPRKGEVLVLFCTFRIADVNESSGPAYKEDVADGLPIWTPQLHADVNRYRDQLQKCAGAKYTLHFSMRNNQRMYELVHATKSLVGLKVMKKVMYNMSQELDHEMEDFEFHFSDLSLSPLPPPERGSTQNTMSDQARQACAERLRDHFQGKEATLMEIEEHVLLRTAHPYFIGTLKAAAASRFILSVENENGGRRPK